MRHRVYYFLHIEYAIYAHPCCPSSYAFTSRGCVALRALLLHGLGVRIIGLPVYAGMGYSAQRSAALSIACPLPLPFIFTIARHAPHASRHTAICLSPCVNTPPPVGQQRGRSRCPVVTGYAGVGAGRCRWLAY